MENNEVDYKELYERASGACTDLRQDIAILKAQVSGDVVAIGSTREQKIARQRKALRRLNRRVRVQRLQLRRLNELERGLRPEEWVALKTDFAHELEDDQWNLEE